MEILQKRGLTTEEQGILNFLNYQNSSKADTGIIPADGFIKRMLFNQNERTNNPSGYAGAVQALGGEDLVSTRLYWDIEGPNF